MTRPLAGTVALVAGATRGAGRGIAEALGEAGATVWCTGRSSRATPRAPAAPASATPDPHAPFELARRPETIEETAERVTALGGEGIAAVVDHARPEQVEALAARIRAEHGHLDLLVHDIWGGEAWTEWGVPFWELDLGKGFALLQNAVHTHVVTARHLAPLLFARRGLLVEVTDGDDLCYRSTLFYDLAKTSVIRLAFAFAEELRPHGVTAVAVTPGFLRSEAMLEHMGVTAETWREGAREDPHFAYSESPRFVGRCLAALAADPDRFARSGRALSSWGLGRDYGVVDVDGTRPDWGAHAAGEPFKADQVASHRRFVAGVTQDA